jgi:hypothetical protein
MYLFMSRGFYIVYRLSAKHFFLTKTPCRCGNFFFTRVRRVAYMKSFTCSAALDSIKFNSVAFSPQANYTERLPLVGEVSANF